MAGNNRTALQSAGEEAEKNGFNTFIITDSLRGDTSEACSYISGEIYNYLNNNEISKPVCLLFGGETTVKVEGNGKGGRNQHLALSMAFRLQESPGITFVAAGTDGNDGDTDAAGAVTDSDTIRESNEKNIDPEAYLRNFDSYNYFRQSEGLSDRSDTHQRNGPDNSPHR
jgi:hydroxypyruvate reductase/glycerate 2-kinase